MKQAVQNTFFKGLNRDLGKIIPQNEFLYWNENFRLSTQEGQSNGMLENVKGNDKLMTTFELVPTQIQVEEKYSIIGHYVFNDKDLVVFAVNDALGTDNYPISSKIYLFKYNSTNTQEGYYPAIILYYDDNNDDATNGLRLKNKITCIGRVESNYDKHIYWVDGENSLRHANISPDIDSSTGKPYSGLYSIHYTKIQNQLTWEFNIVGPLCPPSINFIAYGSGNLKVGKVQYGCRLFNENGTVSNVYISPELISIPRKIDNDSNSIYGDAVNSNSYKSIKFKIDIFSSEGSLTYDYIEVYGIYYNNNNSSPIVKVIGTYDNTNSLYIEDNGNDYESLSTIDDITNIDTNIIPYTLEHKDDTLFLGNIKENNFDIDYDARAYRFNSSKLANLYTASGSLINTIVGDNPHYDYEENCDCYNKFNDLNNDGSSTYDFKYKIDGITLGGTGPNVNYEFGTSNYVIDNYSAGSNVIHGVISNKYFLGNYKGFQRDEIYRFGVVFYNKELIPSFVHWIGDIRMPTAEEYPITTISGNFTYGIALYPIFHFSNLPSTVKYYKIVYVPRTVNDRTVLATGFSTPTIFLNREDEYERNMHIFPHYFAGSPEETMTKPIVGKDNLLEFISPDIDINQLDLNNTYFQPRSFRLLYYNSCILLRESETWTMPLMILYKYKIDDDNNIDHTKYYTVKKFLQLDTPSDYKIGVGTIMKDLTISRKRGYYAPSVYTIDSGIGVAAVHNNTNGVAEVKQTRYISGTDLIAGCMIKPNVLYLSSSVPNIKETSNVFKSIYGYIRRKIFGYGGVSYENRLSNNYISASNIISTSISSISCLYGDTYIGYYERMRNTLSRVFRDTQGIFGKNYEWGSILACNDRQSPDAEGSSDKFCQSQDYTGTINFPVETSVVLPYLHSFKMNPNCENKTVRLVTDKNNKKTITEEITYNNDDGTESYYDEEVLNYEDLFLYNSAYSVINTTNNYFHKPLLWKANNIYNNRILYSEIKYNGERKNSWLKFKTNNFQDVDTNFGQIEQLLKWKNYIFCFQHNGMCILPINERTINSTQEGTPIVLTSGSVISSFFNYSQGSELYGLQNGNKAISTEQGIYWIDILHKKLLRFSGSSQELNFVTGLSSWLRENINEKTSYFSGYDNQFKEVLFSFSNSNITLFNQTLVFSESINNLQGVYTFFTNRYIMLPELISVYGNKTLWEHNIGNRTKWYNVLYPSIVELIVNDNVPLTKQFNNIEYISESIDYEQDERGVDMKDDTFNTIQVFNDYKESLEIPLLVYLNGDILYTGGMKIPVTAPSTIKNIRRRERVWRTVIPRVDELLNIDKYRMRDVYLKLRLKYNNTNNYKFVSHPITTYYDQSIVQE